MREGGRYVEGTFCRTGGAGTCACDARSRLRRRRREGGGGGDDLLASVEDRGTLKVSTDPAYPPQSKLNEKTGKYEGFDIDVATEIAKRLDVDVAWEAPAWDTIVAGNWNGRWDVSVGSMTITPERAEVLHFTPPYYYTPAAFAVHKDNTTITDASDLSGKTVGVCGGCTYDKYLQNKLELSQDESGTPEKVESVVTDPKIRTYDTDSTAIQDLALGDGRRLDAVISALPTLQAAIKQARRSRWSAIRSTTSRCRWRSTAARSSNHKPRRSDLGDHRRDARRRHADGAVPEVVRRRPHRRADIVASRDGG